MYNIVQKVYEAGQVRVVLSGVPDGWQWKMTWWRTTKTGIEPSEAEARAAARRATESLHRAAACAHNERTEIDCARVERLLTGAGTDA
jgi:hypothetical protein